MIPVTGLCLLVLTFVNSVLFVELVKVQRLGCLTLFNRIIYILRYTVFKVRCKNKSFEIVVSLLT